MDYFQILNLEREPFSNSPEPEFFFQSNLHLACLQKLELAVRLRRGLNVIMGDVGTGKTTLCRQLILNFSQTDEDRKEIETHLILDPSFSNAQEFLSNLSLLLGIGASDDIQSEWQLKENIKNYLFQRGVSEGKIVVLIIDEGQKLPDFCLEILREFLNYETNEYKLLQIVIFAQKEFEQALTTHNSFADRINLHYYLKPLNFKNSIEMIRFRLTVARADHDTGPAIFTWPALWVIYLAAGGYPRKIITLCHQIIITTIIRNSMRAGFFLTLSCAGKVIFEERLIRWRWALTFAGAGLLLIILILAYGRMGISTSPQEKIADKILPKTEVKAASKADKIRPPAAAVKEQVIKKKEAPAKLAAKEEGLQTKGAPATPAASTTKTKEVPATPVASATKAKEVPTESVAAAAKEAPAVSVALTPKELPQDRRAKPSSRKKPDILGQLKVRANDNVLTIMERIYGQDSAPHATFIARTNPHIRDMHRVTAGMAINVPALRFAETSPLPKGKYWVAIAEPKNLTEAYDLLTKYPEMPPLFLLPCWSERDGVSFPVLLKEGFADEAAAEWIIKTLPPPFPDHAKVIKEWSKETLFL